MKTVIKAFLFILSFLSFSEEPVALCLYAPDIPVQNFKKLKTDFCDYFKKKENLYFQPFANQGDFESYLNDKKNFMAIIPGSQLKALTSRDKLQTLYYGVFKNESDEKFFLIFKKNLKFDKLKKIHIATALDAQIVGDILSRNQSMLKDVKSEILPVSKDIDALMSLTFNVFHVDVAIVSEKVYNLYSARNKTFSKELTKVDSNFCAKKTIVIAPKDCAKTIYQKSKILTKLSEDKKGREFMTFLSLDSWKVCKKNREMEGSNEK